MGKIIIFLVIVLIVEIAGGFYLLNNKAVNNLEYKEIQTTPLPTAVPTFSTPISSPSIISSDRKYTIEEIGTHAVREDCWLVIERKVYNVTAFISSHPGGDMILNGCGKDATVLFAGVRDHSEIDVQGMLNNLQVGVLK